MTEGKQQHYIFALVGIGSLLVLYMLWREMQQQPAASSVIPSPSGGPQYPTIPVPAIDLGDVILSAPPATVYNVPLDGEQLPTVKIGSELSDCGCQDNDCEQAGLPVTIQTVSPSVLKQSVLNLDSFRAKTQPVLSGVQAARGTIAAGRPGTA
jgi:hypothetical protein